MQPSPYAAPETRVRSEALSDGKSVVKRPGNPGMWPLAIVLLVFGAIGWLAGGKYTVEGWVIALNMFARWIGVTSALPMPRGWWLVGAVLVSGLIYSRVELLIWRKNTYHQPYFWIGWAIVVLTDVSSTLLGVLNPQPDAPRVFLQLAAVPILAALWSIVLTAAPEYLILNGWKLLRR